MSHCAQCTNSLNIYLCKPYVRRPSKQSKEVLKYLHTAYAAPKVISNAHWGHNFDQVPNTEQCAKHCLLIDGFVSRRLCRRVCSSIFFQNVNKEIAHVLKMQGNNDDETFSCDFLKLFFKTNVWKTDHCAMNRTQNGCEKTEYCVLNWPQNEMAGHEEPALTWVPWNTRPVSKLQIVYILFFAFLLVILATAIYLEKLCMIANSSWESVRKVVSKQDVQFLQWSLNHCALLCFAYNDRMK